MADTGCGISQNDMRNLFNPFFKSVDNERRQAQKSGNGLGLNICKKIAKSLGGDIQVESKVNQGSNFTFTFICEFKEPQKPQPRMRKKVTRKQTPPLCLI